MDKKKAVRRISPAWAKEDLEVSDKEVTLRGHEHHDEMRDDPMITAVEYATREQGNIHKLQNRSVIGLAWMSLGALIVFLVLAGGVADHWWDEQFVEVVLGSIIPPPFAAWMYIVKRTFPARK